MSKTEKKDVAKVLTTEEYQKQLLDLELRKVKSLEKIANTLDALTIWFEEIDKGDWSSRIQFYLAEYHNMMVKKNDLDK